MGIWCVPQHELGKCNVAHVKRLLWLFEIQIVVGKGDSIPFLLGLTAYFSGAFDVIFRVGPYVCIAKNPGFGCLFEPWSMRVPNLSQHPDFSEKFAKVFVNVHMYK